MHEVRCTFGSMPHMSNSTLHRYLEEESRTLGHILASEWRPNSSEYVMRVGDAVSAEKRRAFERRLDEDGLVVVSLEWRSLPASALEQGSNVCDGSI